MKEYHKIETLFERDMNGSKKLIEGKYRNECVEYLKDLEWIFTEKIDGTNIRVHWDGHKVQFGGRTDNAQIPSGLVAKLNELFLGSETEQVFEQKFGETPVTLYGEGYGGKIQGGGNYKKEHDFILFDVEVGNTFLSRENCEEIAKSFSLNMVPIVMVSDIQTAVDYIKTKPRSTISENKEFEMEGVVGTPQARLYDVKGNRVIVKIKVKDFC
jgi:hypothetical protein